VIPAGRGSQRKKWVRKVSVEGRLCGIRRGWSDGLVRPSHRPVQQAVKDESLNGKGETEPPPDMRLRRLRQRSFSCAGGRFPKPWTMPGSLAIGTCSWTRMCLAPTGEEAYLLVSGSNRRSSGGSRRLPGNATFRLVAVNQESEVRLDFLGESVFGGREPGGPAVTRPTPDRQAFPPFFLPGTGTRETE